MRVALKVLVSMMSAPASRNASWIARDHLGLGQHEQVVVALQIVRMVAEPARRRAAKVGLAELLSLDHRAHRAVEDEDAFAQQPLQQRGLVGRRHGAAKKTKNPFSLPPSGFRAKAALAGFV